MKSNELLQPDPFNLPPDTGRYRVPFTFKNDDRTINSSKTIQSTPEEDEKRLNQVLKDANTQNLEWDKETDRQYMLLFPGTSFSLPISDSWISIKPIPFTTKLNRPELYITNEDKVRNYTPDTYLAYINANWNNLSRDDRAEIKTKLSNRSCGDNYLKQINFLLTLNKILFKQKGGMSNNNKKFLSGGDSSDSESSDDDKVFNLVKEYEPELVEEMNGGAKNIKDFADQKVISPYLLGSFVNGELSIPQVAKLGGRTSRRKLFKKIA